MPAEPRAGQGELGRAGLGLPSVCRIRPGAQTRLGQDPALLVLRGSQAAPAASSPSADVPKQDALHPKAPSTRALSLAPSCSFPPFLPSLWRGGFGVWSRGSPQSPEAGQGLLALSPISSPCTRGAGGTEGTEAMPSTCQAHSSLSWAPGGSAGYKTSPFLCWNEPNAFKLPLHLSLDPAWFFIAQSVAPPQGQLDHFQFARKPIKLQLNVIKRP